MPQNARALPSNERRRDLLALVVIVALGIIIYGRCVTFDYSLYDDPNIIFDNPNIQGGLTFRSIIWAFTTPNFGLYQPFPSVTYMLDSHLFGTWPGGYHAMTLLWHLLAACALFVLLRGLLDNFPVAFAAALMFSAHPVNAMSVNWVMARNETMPGFFLLMSVEAYRRFVVKGSPKARIASLAFMLMAFMGKQGGVLLPLVFLLLDYWPLRRIKVSLSDPMTTLRDGTKCAIEKLPWCVISVVGILLAFYGKTDLFDVLERNTFATPINNVSFAVVAYVRYLFHFIYPVRYLFSFPPDHEWVTFAITAAATLILVAITGIAIFLHARRPYLIVGWGWFVFMLLPVSGLISYANEAIALRYMYAPAVGLYIITACALYDMALRRKRWDAREGMAEDKEYKEINRRLRLWYWPPVVTITVLWAALCFWQSGFWKDSETLALRALDLTDGKHALAHNHLGVIRLGQGKLHEAAEHAQTAFMLDPDAMLYRLNYAQAMQLNQNYAEAQRILEPIAEERADVPIVLNRYGEALLGLGRTDEASEYFQRAVDIEPGFVNALYNLARCLIVQERKEEAKRYLERIATGMPSHTEARKLLESLK